MPDTAASAASTATAAAQGNADPSTFSNYAWAALVLALAGDPITQNNLDNFTTWMTAENGSGTWTGTAGTNNPLNNGLGSGGGNGTGSYPDLATAAAYAAKGINGGIQNAAQIGAALKANAPWSVFQQATINSDWASSHYAGSDYARLSSAAPPPSVTISQASSHSSTHGPSLGSVNNAVFTAADEGLVKNAESSANTLTGGVAGDVASAVTGAAGLEAVAGKVLSEVSTLAFWERFGMGALGVALIVGGAIVFFSSTKTGQKTVSEGTSAAEVAAVA